VRAGRWAAVAWLCIGLGVITKGPVAIALPLLVAIPYAIWRRRFGALWSWLGIIAFVASVAPWVWAISRAVPDFLHYVVVTETAQRLATKALKRTGPPWYFVPYLIGGALPWSIAAIAASRGASRPRDRETARPDLYLLLWIAIPFIFFSISQSKRPQYILPVMPAVALLVAHVWPRGRRAAAIALIVFGVLLSAALPFVHLREEYAGAARGAAIALGVTALIGGLVALFTKRALAIVGLSLPMIAIPMATNPLVNAIGARRSTRDFMAQVAPLVTPQTQVVGVEAFTGSMSFYLRRPIVVVTPDAEEFTSNYIIRHYSVFAGSAALQPTSWLPGALADRSTPRLFVVRAGDAANRARIEAAGYRLAASSPRYAAYAASTMPP
jgi:4-amino-4-deoxy-L-arabinose transferase-like glycosyltransferase